jgi:hypothetical protein
LGAADERLPQHAQVIDAQAAAAEEVLTEELARCAVALELAQQACTDRKVGRLGHRGDGSGTHPLRVPGEGQTAVLVWTKNGERFGAARHFRLLTNAPWRQLHDLYQVTFDVRTQFGTQ